MSYAMDRPAAKCQNIDRWSARPYFHHRMAHKTPPPLSRRERELLDVVYRLERATAAEIHAQLKNPPTLTTVRGLLRVLETKGHVRHEEDGKRFVYFPRTPRSEAGRSLLQHVVSTFFAGSPSEAVAALVGAQRDALSDEEIARLSAVIDNARRGRR
jgi:predicted transcriptional regulator